MTSRALPGPVADVLAEASGRSHRDDAVLARTGGPAGNAQLTAYLGLALLAMFVVELVTVLDVQGMLSWHVAVGGLLVPFAVYKTGTTSWRLARYYGGHRPYQVAGPPPLLLRALGPLVVVATLGLLGTGVALILLGPSSGSRPLVTLLGQGLDVLTLHQALFIAFCVVTGLHLLARLVPAALLAAGRVERASAEPGRALPGRALRLAVLGTAVVLAVLTAVLLVHRESSWQHDRQHFGRAPSALTSSR